MFSGLWAKYRGAFSLIMISGDMSYELFVNRALTLWEADHSLTVALDNCKALLRPIDYLTSIWPCNGELLPPRYKCESDLLYGRTKGSLPSFTQTSGRCLSQRRTSSPSPNGPDNGAVLIISICFVVLFSVCFRVLCSRSSPRICFIPL